jgi:hypothetical protein
MRVGLLHLGQSVDFVVSITFLRSPVFAILAIGGVFLLLGLSLHTSAAADGFNGAVLNSHLPCLLCNEIAGEEFAPRKRLEGPGLAPISLHQVCLALLQLDASAPVRAGDAVAGCSICGLVGGGCALAGWEASAGADCVVAGVESSGTPSGFAPG